MTKTATVIDFSAVLNARRVATKQAEAATVQAKQNDERRQAGYKAFNYEPVAMQIVDAVADLVEQNAEKAKAERYTPAYCDPANEVQGSKYTATKDLSMVEIAARIRADMKAAQKTGTIPASIKLSVTTKLYSGGGSIDVKITALPTGFKVWNPDYAAWRRANPHDGWPPFTVDQQNSPEYRSLLQRLKAIHGAYNRDNSDGMSDYFDRRYYGDVGLEWRLADAMRKAEGL